MFTESESRLLWSVVSRRDRSLLPALQNLTVSNVSNEVADQLINLVGSELADFGFDRNDVLTDQGSALEALIGKMVRELKTGGLGSSSGSAVMLLGALIQAHADLGVEGLFEAVSDA